MHCALTGAPRRLGPPFAGPQKRPSGSRAEHEPIIQLPPSYLCVNLSRKEGSKKVTARRLLAGAKRPLRSSPAGVVVQVGTSSGGGGR